MKRVASIRLREGWHVYDRGDVDPNRPGIYEWNIEGVGSYIGKYTRISRPERDYANNLLKMMNGWPYRPKYPERFRRIHRELRSAYERGSRITLTLVENVEPTDLHRRESELIAQREAVERSSIRTSLT